MSANLEHDPKLLDDLAELLTQIAEYMAPRADQERDSDGRHPNAELQFLGDIEDNPDSRQAGLLTRVNRARGIKQ